MQERVYPSTARRSHVRLIRDTEVDRALRRAVAKTGTRENLHSAFSSLSLRRRGGSCYVAKHYFTE
jgi:hypothetical protein